ncbi:MAG: primosomal protein N' [Deltaproteobacteria bacterium]|nr:primosomal protein N' [Deltaproteobacteria bacterium]
MTGLPYVEVAVDLPVYHTFTYEVPKPLSSIVCAGKRVLVPFSERKISGYVLGAGNPSIIKDVKPILDVLDETPLFPASMIPFFQWISSYYMHPIGNVIKCALPAGVNLYEAVIIELTEEGQAALTGGELTSLEAKILKGLKRSGPCRLKKFLKNLEADVSAALIHRLECRGWITRRKELRGAEIKPKMERFAALLDPTGPLEGLSLQRLKIIEALSANPEMPVADLKKIVPSASRLIKAMEISGHVRLFHRAVYRDPFGESIPPDTPPILSAEQQKAVETVLNSFGKGFSTYLLAGVTGSGKTEVYMQLAAAALQQGYQVLVLVPEIALISQMQRRFRARFGDCVAILHSGLSGGERYDQWLRILRKEVNIAIGARSAIFAPFSEVGLIIVDEEHDSSYKQEHQLRYNARDLAVVRAKLQKAVVLLGSATPSVQSYHNVKRQNFVELILKNRVEKRCLPQITVVDLCKIRHKRGIRRFLSDELVVSIRETLNRSEQVLLFLNRRGYASFPICASCGEPVRCKNCDISLTLHRKINAYKCHYCGFAKPAVSNCSACGSAKIQLLGLGTEKIEGAVKSLFPTARVARMDRDTTRAKGSLLKLLKGLRSQTIDILVGTQMVAKGHDFPNITLVGIICADLSLNFPDFRAGERTFQLLAQVSGRAGRGESPGKVVLQTYNPNHFSIITAQQQDFIAFYEKEIQFREALKYPPFTRMILIKISGKNQQQTEKAAQAVGKSCRSMLKTLKTSLDTIQLLGPVAAPVPKISGRYRWQLLLKGSDVKALHRLVHQVLLDNRSLMNNRQVTVAVDVDPVDMM